MRNPCNNCKIRWLCAPYGGRCWRKKLFIRKMYQDFRKASNTKVSELQDHANEILYRIENRMEEDYGN